MYEVNFLIPLTEMRDSSSFNLEDSPYSNSFHKVKPMKYSNFLQFFGAQCFHYSDINVTGKTRVSFDFRVVLHSKFKEFVKENHSQLENPNLYPFYSLYYSAYNQKEKKFYFLSSQDLSVSSPMNKEDYTNNFKDLFNDLMY